MWIKKYLFWLNMTCLVPMIANIHNTAYADDTREIDEIKVVYETGRQLELDSTTTQIRLMRLFQEGGRSRWIEFEPESTAFSIAVIYFANGYISSAAFSEFTPSGDWVEYTNNYYRRDGSLAFVFSDFRTFHGDVKIESSFYYSSAGKVLDSINTYYDLLSGEKLEEEPSYFKAERYQDIFETADELIDSLGYSNLFHHHDKGHNGQE